MTAIKASEERRWLRIQPDTTWGLEEIRERFEVPADMPPSMVEMVGRKVASAAIERYERLKHWKFRADIPVVLDVSALQTDLSLTASPLVRKNLDALQAVDQGILQIRTGMKAYVMVMTFETQKIVHIEQEVSRNEGFLNADEPIHPEDIVKVDGN